MPPADPPLLSTEALQARLTARRVGKKIVVVETTTSTNDYAMRCGREGHSEGLVVFAEHQTQGRGRLQRLWDSQRGQGLWFSLLLRPTTPPVKWPRFATAAALGVARGIEAILPVTANIKWPNDILLNGRKVAGILLESHLEKNAGFLVIGIGINVNQTSFPPPLTATATSLQLVGGRMVDRVAVAAAVITALDAVICSMDMEDSWDETIVACSRRSTLLGQQVTVDTGVEKIRGLAESLDSDGQLILLRADDTRFAAGYGEASVVAND